MKPKLPKNLPGVTVYKSLGEALAGVSEELEKHHFEATTRLKAEHKKTATKLMGSRSR